MAMSLLKSIIPSSVRIKILMRLFFNPDQKAYIRGLADEFDVSPSQVSQELKQLEKSNLLQSERNGRQKLFQANTSHPLFPELQSMVRKALGMDRILEVILEKLGDLELALVIDDYAEGKDTGIIDLVLVGNVDRRSLQYLVQRAEMYTDRKVRTLVLSEQEFVSFKKTLNKRPSLVLWRRNELGNG